MHHRHEEVANGSAAGFIKLCGLVFEDLRSKVLSEEEGKRKETSGGN